jgi:leucyl aminopeptidase
VTISPAAYFAKPNERAVPVTPLAKAAFAAWKRKAPTLERALALAQGFEAGEKEVLVVPGKGGVLSRVVLGLGANGSLPELLSAAASRLPEGVYAIEGRLAQKDADQTALLWALGQYDFSRYRKNHAKAPRKLRWPGEANAKRVLAMAKGVFLARDLINTPTNDMGPDELAKAAAALAREFKAKLTVTVGDALLKKKLPAIHAVGRAAATAPRLIDLSWGKPKHPKVTLVGKGVCFDTGGLNLKSESGMRLMKKDMGGGAVALGLARAIMEAKLPVRLRVLVPAVENAVSGNAYRPGDVIATRKGISVEIGNTDAEGRIVLCDALALADEERPALLLDFATLTGAAKIALGPDIGALYSTDDALANALLAAGAETGDPLWRLPLWQPYKEHLKSPIADLSNIASTSYAGSITAALYLQQFVAAPTRWAHFDLYCWNSSDMPGKPKGADASGLLAAFSFLETRFRS